MESSNAVETFAIDNDARDCTKIPLSASDIALELPEKKSISVTSLDENGRHNVEDVNGLKTVVTRNGSEDEEASGSDGGGSSSNFGDRERLAPLGASEIGEDAPPMDKWDPGDDEYETCSLDDFERYRALEEEQEQLNASLIALTTHFAQVQFRLKQIVDASPEQREILLKDLEEFAFRGIPEMRLPAGDLLEMSESGEEHELKMEKQRDRQRELIGQLKVQLEDLEKYAYETGEGSLPSSMLMEKQAVVLEQLKQKLPLNIDEFEGLAPEQLKEHVDRAIREMISPVRMNEQLLSQLRTQVTDLERFIQFIQGAKGADARCTCKCALHGKAAGSVSDDCCSSTPSDLGSAARRRQPDNGYASATERISRRMNMLLQMFALAQFGCGVKHFERNVMKRTPKGNHWGDLRARLEIATNQLIEIASEQDRVDSDYTSDSEDSPSVQCNERVTTAARKDFASALRDLMQHGLMQISTGRSLVPIGCFPVRGSTTGKMLHAWDFIVKYYELKNGPQFNSSPVRKLSQSFNLEVVNNRGSSPKQSLLSAVHNIISTHTPLKRSPDSHFKAFVCAGLNEKRLVAWLKLITRCRSLVEVYYMPWSYVRKAGFEDALRSLDRLTVVDFDLPVDLAVRQLQNIKDAF